MTTPIIDPSTLSEEQREAIKERYNYIRKRWKQYYKPNIALAANVFAGHLEAFEYLFGSEFFKPRDNE